MAYQTFRRCFKVKCGFRFENFSSLILKNGSELLSFLLHLQSFWCMERSCSTEIFATFLSCFAIRMSFMEFIIRFSFSRLGIKAFILDVSEFMRFVLWFIFFLSAFKYFINSKIDWYHGTWIPVANPKTLSRSEANPQAIWNACYHINLIIIWFQRSA